jgi:hypothetical protein
MLAPAPGACRLSVSVAAAQRCTQRRSDAPDGRGDGSWVRTCRRELLDRTMIFNQRHLLHALREYEVFYNEHRPEFRSS